MRVICTSSAPFDVFAYGTDPGVGLRGERAWFCGAGMLCAGSGTPAPLVLCSSFLITIASLGELQNHYITFFGILLSYLPRPAPHAVTFVHHMQSLLFGLSRYGCGLRRVRRAYLLGSV